MSIFYMISVAFTLFAAYIVKLNTLHNRPGFKHRKIIRHCSQLHIIGASRAGRLKGQRLNRPLRYRNNMATVARAAAGDIRITSFYALLDACFTT